MTVYAIDPGPHTGIFWMNGTMPYWVTLDLRREKRPHRALYDWLRNNVNSLLDDKVVYESFEFRKEDAHEREYIDYSPGELVGVIILFCELMGTDCFRQTAASAKGFWDDDKLKRAKLYIPGKEARHVRDATRHWLYYHTLSPYKDAELSKEIFLRLK